MLFRSPMPVTATGFGSTAWTIFGTNTLFQMGPNGVTNNTGLNMEIFSLQGSGFWISNTITGQLIRLAATISGSGCDVKLHPGDALLGNGVTETGDYSL